MPILLGMLMVQRDVQTAISSAIVNQQYARATMHFLFFNHRWYPEEQFVTLTGRGRYMQRWWVGVQDQHDDTQGGVDRPPKAPEIKVGIAKARDDETPGAVEEVKTRQNVRIRAESFVCLPMRGIKLEAPYSIGANMPNDAFLAGNVSYCRD